MSSSPRPTVADISDVKVQITLTIGEMKTLVALMNLGSESLAEDDVPEIVDEVSGLYFDLMENIRSGYLGEFEPEQ
jgi:hypothetical protein